MSERERNSGLYTFSVEARCACAHGLGEHTAARVKSTRTGKASQPCLADGCRCECFKKAK